MNTDYFKGIIPPIVTPIDEHERIIEKDLREHIDFMIKGGISGILAFGSNGEFYMQEEEEQKEILSIIIDQVNNRIPVYMGIGAIRTSKCIRLAQMGLEMGAKGISVLQPMFIKPSEEELYKHFKTIATNVNNSPLILYNNPGRTGYPLSLSLVERLAHDVENIIGIKDSSGDITNTEELIRRNRDVGFRVMCGKDTMIYTGLCVGAVGAVCSTANFVPDLVCSIYNKYIKGDLKGSLEDQFKLNPIRIEMDSTTFPVATKDMGNILGRKLGMPYRPTLPGSKQKQEHQAAVLKVAGYKCK